MALATSRLLRLLQALHRWLLRVYKPQFAGWALTGIFRRLALLWRLLRSKLAPLAKRNDKPPKGELSTTKDPVEDATNNQISYTVIQDGDTISLDKASFSLYPFSSNGIRNTSRTSIRQGNPQSRSVSRSSHRPESNYSHSVNGSVYDLPLYPVRPPSRVRNPRRQLSTSMPDLHSPITARPRRVWLPQPRSPSPGGDVDIEVVSPIDPQSGGNIYEQHLHGRDQHAPSASNKPYSPSSSPPPGIEVEPTSPISPIPEGNSPGNMSETSLQVPSSEHSTPYSSRTSPDVMPEVIPLGPVSTRDSNENIHEHSSSRSTPNENRKIKSVLPDNTLRYTRRTRALKKFKNMQIDELTTMFDRPAAPAGWLRFAHPEGACYYYHAEKRVYTDSHLSDPDILDRTMDDIVRLERLRDTLEQPFPQNAVLMIDVNRLEDGDLETSYYYADHDERTIFYLHAIETWDIDAAWEVTGVKSYRHLGYEMQGQYWHFVSLYPDSCSLTTAMVCELRDIVLYLIGDTMTSPYSTSPYTLDVLIQILNITSEMEKNAQPGYPGCMALFARHMYIFYHTRFLNCHGESFARIERDFSIFGEPLNKRTWLVKTLSFVLFSAPDVHLRNLQKMWVDGIMHKSVWEQTMKSLNDEWQEFVFFATVMLTSNVGFLAIQSVDTDDDPFRSSAQILSYLSVVANTGTLILGLLLMRQNRTKMKDTADDVQDFLRARNHPRLGLETLAILYSLPYALLMWGVVAFLGAFCCVFFQNSNVQTRSFVGSLSFAVAILIVWCIITSWENKNHAPEVDRPLSYEEQQETEDSTSEAPPIKYSIFEKIRSFPVLSHIRRYSADSERTAV